MRELTPEVIKSLSNEQLELLVEIGELAKWFNSFIDRLQIMNQYHCVLQNLYHFHQNFHPFFYMF